MEGWARAALTFSTRAPASMTVENGLGELFGRGARHLAVRRCRLGKDGPHQQGAVGADCRSDRSPLGGQDPSDKGAVQARRAGGLGARAAVVSGNLAEAFARQIGMLGNDRSIDEPDLQLRAAAGAFHQRSELDQVQRAHNLTVSQAVDKLTLAVASPAAGAWQAASSAWARGHRVRPPRRPGGPSRYAGACLSARAAVAAFPPAGNPELPQGKRMRSAASVSAG